MAMKHKRCPMLVPLYPVAPEDGTGVGPEDRTGALCPLPLPLTFNVSLFTFYVSLVIPEPGTKNEEP